MKTTSQRGASTKLEFSELTPDEELQRIREILRDHPGIEQRLSPQRQHYLALILNKEATNANAGVTKTPAQSHSSKEPLTGGARLSPGEARRANAQSNLRLNAAGDKNASPRTSD